MSSTTSTAMPENTRTQEPSVSSTTSTAMPENTPNSLLPNDSAFPATGSYARQSRTPGNALLIPKPAPPVPSRFTLFKTFPVVPQNFPSDNPALLATSAPHAHVHSRVMLSNLKPLLRASVSAALKSNGTPSTHASSTSASVQPGPCDYPSQTCLSLSKGSDTASARGETQRKRMHEEEDDEIVTKLGGEQAGKKRRRVEGGHGGVLKVQGEERERLGKIGAGGVHGKSDIVGDRGGFERGERGRQGES